MEELLNAKQAAAIVARHPAVGSCSVSFINKVLNGQRASDVPLKGKQLGNQWVIRRGDLDDWIRRYVKHRATSR